MEGIIWKFNTTTVTSSGLAFGQMLARTFDDTGQLLTQRNFNRVFSIEQCLSDLQFPFLLNPQKEDYGMCFSLIQKTQIHTPEPPPEARQAG
ncbi:hypothetical protein L5515_012305 [Caenorhabditis briggsae]|uniref:Uncharacterized protein n=1 Tax=Caenorhabditis briggsae TaxID=6238 RepID=A0AAE9ES78_CAEBR|nr:hypothetical protein L5515_012305 [Caenorhabditis briggsae]